MYMIAKHINQTNQAVGVENCESYPSPLANIPRPVADARVRPSIRCQLGVTGEGTEIQQHCVRPRRDLVLRRLP